MRRRHPVEVFQRKSDLRGKVLLKGSLLKQEKAVIATIPIWTRFCFRLLP